MTVSVAGGLQIRKQSNSLRSVQPEQSSDAADVTV
jgi:hypothetical protein